MPDRPPARFDKASFSTPVVASACPVCPEGGAIKMTRVLCGLVAAAFGAAVSAGSVSAADQTVQQYSFHGTVAEAVWSTSSATDSTSTDLTVSRTQQGRRLSIYQ